MLISRSFMTYLVATTLLAACSEAKFTGANGSKAISQTPPSGDAAGLSCTVTPAVVKAGDKVTIAVTAANYDGVVFQTASGPDGSADATLAKSDAGYTLDGGAANEIVSKSLGDTKIELRLSKDQADAAASCTFTATADGQPPAGTPSTGDSPNGGTPSTGDSSTNGTPSTGDQSSDGDKPCTQTQQSIGAQIAFLIDNSNSNSATDCPAAKKAGTFNGTDLYECGAATNRENAVLAAYDLLAKIAADEPGNAKALSSLAIASFPTAQDYVGGWHQESQGWIGADANGRGNTSNSMLFARKPSGLTPYGAAMSAATELFKTAANDGRAKVAVLVTDGEPTDRDPGGVQAQADALKQAGVQVIVVTYNETHASRAAEHTKMMKEIDDSQNPHHWYASSYGSFDSYMQALIGSGSQGGLVQTLAAPGKTIEVKDSAALKDAFLKIIKTQAIGCEK